VKLPLKHVSFALTSSAMHAARGQPSSQISSIFCFHSLFSAIKKSNTGHKNYELLTAVTYHRLPPPFCQFPLDDKNALKVQSARLHRALCASSCACTCAFWRNKWMNEKILLIQNYATSIHQLSKVTTNHLFDEE